MTLPLYVVITKSVLRMLWLCIYNVLVEKEIALPIQLRTGNILYICKM